MKVKHVAATSPSEFEKELQSVLMGIRKEKLIDIKYQTSSHHSHGLVYSAIVIYTV